MPDNNNTNYPLAQATWRRIERALVDYLRSHRIRLDVMSGETIVQIVRYLELVDDDAISIDGVEQFSITAFAEHLAQELRDPPTD